MSEEKYEKLYYRIGEVAEMFNVNASLIRYWESEFSVLRPRKSTKGNRMFTQRDLRYLRMIYQLVKVQGYTLQGAKDALKKDFDQLERKTTVLMTLEKTKKFLLELDKELEKSQQTTDNGQQSLGMRSAK
ncbi:MAG: MerR family transcriptional regulator [Bacteroidales bacterium]|nr:MerR family transcriptional regulator [Bacteroidales bacterium]